MREKKRLNLNKTKEATAAIIFLGILEKKVLKAIVLCFEEQSHGNKWSYRDKNSRQEVNSPYTFAS